MPRTSWTLLLILSLAAAACDSGGPPVEDEIDFDRLFAEPTPGEIATVRAEWGARAAGGAYEPGSVTVEYDDDLLGDGSRVLILSHTTGPSSVVHYGAVRVPPGDGPFPAIVAHHGGDQGLDLGAHLGALTDEALFAPLADAAIVVLPVYRAEPMFNTPIGTLLAGGEPSPWDRDVDDSIALLAAALQVLPQADPDRVGTVGFSRGGGVALLMSVRPLPAGLPVQIRAVTEYFGPTDLLAPGFRPIAEQLAFADGSPFEALPGALYLKNRILLPLRFGEMSYEEARNRVLRRSAVYFADRLPATQAHHHRRDAVVFFEQFERLRDREAEIPEHTEFFAYGEPGAPRPQFHSIDPAILPGHAERTIGFLLDQVVAPPAFASWDR